MKLSEVIGNVKAELGRCESGIHSRKHAGTVQRLTRSRVKDLPTHTRYLAIALGREAANEVEAHELTAETLLKVEDHLSALGKGTAVVQNTLSNLRFLQDFSRELGVAIPEPLSQERPKKLPVYKRRHGNRPGGQRITRRRPTAICHDNYALKYRDWPQHLQDEWTDIRLFYTDPERDHCNRKQLRATTLGVRLNVFERFFGFLIQHEIAPEDLTFKHVLNLEFVKAFRRFKYERQNGYTMTTKSELEILRQLALSYFEADECRVAYAKIIGHEDRYRVLKDTDTLVERNHPDELYELVVAMQGEAAHYERNLRKKKGRKYPEAQMAAHWHRAALVAFTLTTWLRERNVSEMEITQLTKRDGVWMFRFGPGQMKGPRAKGDHVIDLWKGERATVRLYQLLEKAVEVRPLLLEKFRLKNPEKEDPKAFFLTEDGNGYSLSGVRELFYSASARYLGPEHVLSPHDVRSIVSSWLFVREGIEMLPTIQRFLDHCSINTTMKHYVRTQRIFNAELAKRQMDEREKQRKGQEELLSTTSETLAAVRMLLAHMQEARGI